LRVLTSLKDYPRTYEAILKHDKEIRDRIVPLLYDTKFREKCEAKPFYYGLGRDRGQRPILIMSMRRLIDSGLSFDDMLYCIDVLATYTTIHALVPGKVETWHGVLDMKDVSIYELPVTSFIAWT